MRVPSVFAMLAQMAFEKFGKAALLRSGAVTLDWAQRSHAASSRMVRAMRLQRGLLAPIGGSLQWNHVLGVVEELERAHPQLVQGIAPATAASTPKLEYPWETSAGEVHWPEAHLRIARRLADATSRLCADVLRFARLLDQRFDQIFPG